MTNKIRLTENDIHKIVKRAIKKITEEFNDDEEFWKSERDAEMNYDLQQFQNAAQKANGTYKASSYDKSFSTGDKVIVHTKKGDIEGIISDFDTNMMSWDETADVDYYKDNGEKFTMLGVPLSRIEKVNENKDIMINKIVQESVNKYLKKVLNGNKM